jgi:hypothetical protein
MFSTVVAGVNKTLMLCTQGSLQLCRGLISKYLFPLNHCEQYSRTHFGTYLLSPLEPNMGVLFIGGTTVNTFERQ